MKESGELKEFLVKTHNALGSSIQYAREQSIINMKLGLEVKRVVIDIVSQVDKRINGDNEKKKNFKINQAAQPNFSKLSKFFK